MYSRGYDIFAFLSLSKFLFKLVESLQKTPGQDKDIPPHRVYQLPPDVSGLDQSSVHRKTLSPNGVSVVPTPSTMVPSINRRVFIGELGFEGSGKPPGAYMELG